MVNPSANACLWSSTCLTTTLLEASPCIDRTSSYNIVTSSTLRQMDEYKQARLIAWVLSKEQPCLMILRKNVSVLPSWCNNRTKGTLLTLSYSNAYHLLFSVEKPPSKMMVSVMETFRRTLLFHSFRFSQVASIRSDVTTFLWLLLFWNTSTQWSLTDVFLSAAHDHGLKPSKPSHCLM